MLVIILLGIFGVVVLGKLGGANNNVAVHQSPSSHATGSPKSSPSSSPSNKGPLTVPTYGPNAAAPITKVQFCSTAVPCAIAHGVADETATFSHPEADLGWMPSHGGTARLSKIVGRSNALELLLSGKALTALDALRLGIVTSYCTGPGGTKTVLSPRMSPMLARGGICGRRRLRACRTTHINTATGK